MPASFAAGLCGYRSDGTPNMSDRSQAHSIAMGRALLATLGVSEGTPAPGTNKIGTLFDASVTADLIALLAASAEHLTVAAQCAVYEFEQYTHLRAVQELSNSETSVPDRLRDLWFRVGALPELQRSHLQECIDEILAEAKAEEQQRRLLLDSIGNESMLHLDVSIYRDLATQANTGALKHLVAALSVKWTLRTDRMQDPISQGAKLAAVRRGRMPHFAAITIEPRPYMLNLLARGSGGLDCVYHLDLPALILAVDEVCTDAQRANRDEFHRLVDQRRIRDYDELVAYLKTL